MTDHFEIAGVMSGTSLDGLDVAYCTFDRINNEWSFTIREARTYKYTSGWKQRLQKLDQGDARELAEVHTAFGKHCGMLVNQFVSETGLRPDFISSHGHTIFHRPDLGYTFQLGSGAAIAAATGISTICDFRTADVALGGQGAPLVPVGDRLLFGDYDFCLNIGGFSNISFEQQGKRIAYDICPANIILNLLATKLGREFDEDGKLSRSGRFIPDLFDKLEMLDYYSLPSPKSLGREWLSLNFLPVIGKNYDHPLEDLMCTVTEHIACRIAKSMETSPTGKVLVSGGGAFNVFLLERLGSFCTNEIIVPDALTVKYKEALIFAFLGILRLLGKSNCLASVTGAARDHCSGAIFPAG